MMDEARSGQAPVGTMRSKAFLWLGPLVYTALVGVFLIARTGGRWAEPDSAVFARIIRVFVDEGRLVPLEGERYPNGYTFQAISSFIVSLTGLDVATLQQIVYPLLAGAIVLPAWALFRELIGTDRGAALATFLLLSQPEFLFVILRSSHEKFSRALMLLCLFLLVKSFQLHDQPRALAKYVIMFYLAMFALIASNNLLAHSFMFSIAVALLAGRILQQRKATRPYDNQRVFRRFQYVLLSCIAVFYVFTFYIYSPAQNQFLVAQNIWDHVAELFLSTEDTAATNAYGVVNTGWVNLRLYFLVSMANWVMLLLSFSIWAVQGIRWVLFGEMPRTRGQWILWLLYASFAGLVVLTAIVDASGALSSNMQQRLFPSFAVFAVALVAGAIDRWRPKRGGGLARAVLAASMACFAVLSVMKATNEPLISNTWTFYRPTEIAALDWTDDHLSNASIWTDFDGRLLLALDTIGHESSGRNQFYGGGLREGSHDIVLSSVARMRSERLKQPLPVPGDALRVYDNGDAEVYHVRPTSPFEP